MEIMLALLMFSVTFTGSGLHNNLRTVSFGRACRGDVAKRKLQVKRQNVLGEICFKVRTLVM